jgi:cardiolipin synthase
VPKRKWLIRKIWQEVEIILDIKNRRRIKRQILKELSQARRSIIVEHAYITDSAIIRRLRQVSRKGVAVRVIMPDRSDGFYHANMRSIHKLLKPTPFTRKKSKKLKVFLYRGMIHAKVILIDEITAILGSANLTHGSFNLLSETSAIFRQKNGISKHLLKQLEKDLRYCSPITLDNLPPYRRWWAWVQKIFI